MPFGNIIWEDGKARFDEHLFAKIESEIDAIEAGTEPCGFSTEAFSVLYSTVYHMCTQKPPYNYSERLANFIGRRAKRVGDKYPPCSESRKRWLKVVSLCFKYLERFYFPRMKMGPLNEWLENKMNEAAVQRERMRKAAKLLPEKVLPQVGPHRGSVSGRLPREWQGAQAPDRMVG